VLTTIERLKKLTGELSPAEEDAAELLIELMSAHIETRTGVSFQLHEDAILRRQATWDGRIELPWPVHAVDSVTVYDTGSRAPHWGWDGNTTLFNLRGHETVDITLTYGLEEVPPDIELVALFATWSMFRSEVRGEPGSLQELAVGDVREKFASGQLDPESVFTESQKELLDSYQEDTWTLRVGAYVPPQSPSDLVNAFQVGG
jgi:hypothetical protein